MLFISCHFGPLKPLTLRMDHAELLDVLTSFPVSHAILPRVMPCILLHHVRQTMQHVAISTAVDRHMSQSEDVYSYIIYQFLILDTAQKLSFCKILYPLYYSLYYLTFRLL